MPCYRRRTDCKEVYAFDSNHGCICMGVINPDARKTPEHSKRLCLVTDNQSYGVQIDLIDRELFVIQQVISGGFLEIMQQALHPTEDIE